MEERGENSRKSGEEQPLSRRRQAHQAKADQDFISPGRSVHPRGIGEVLLRPLEKGNRGRPAERAMIGKNAADWEQKPNMKETADKMSAAQSGNF
jgi:hypothetical protein